MEISVSQLTTLPDIVLNHMSGKKGFPERAARGTARKLYGDPH